MIFFRKYRQTFKHLLKPKSFPSLTLHQRSYIIFRIIDLVPHSETFHFKFRVQTMSALYISLLLVKVLQDHKKTSFMIMIIFYVRSKVWKSFLPQLSTLSSIWFYTIHVHNKENTFKYKNIWRVQKYWTLKENIYSLIEKIEGTFSGNQHVTFSISTSPSIYCQSNKAYKDMLYTKYFYDEQSFL